MEAHRAVRRRGFHIFLNSRLTDDGEVVRHTRRPPITSRKIARTRFCWRLSRAKDHSAAGRIRYIEKFSDIMQNYIYIIMRPGARYL
jgi:hypothetical protein